MVKKPIGTTIDEKIEIKIRNLQSQLIKETNRGWSFSEILNLLLVYALDNADILDIIKNK